MNTSPNQSQLVISLCFEDISRVSNHDPIMIKDLWTCFVYFLKSCVCLFCWEVLCMFSGVFQVLLQAWSWTWMVGLCLLFLLPTAASHHPALLWLHLWSGLRIYLWGWQESRYLFGVDNIKPVLCCSLLIQAYMQAEHYITNKQTNKYW